MHAKPRAKKTFYNTDRSSFFSEEIELIRLPLPEGARSPNGEKQIPLMYKDLRQKKEKKYIGPETVGPAGG